MALKQSERVRQIVNEKYVYPAIMEGKTRLSIRVRDVLKDAEANSDFPRGRTPLVCNVLQSKRLMSEAGLELEGVEGPPSRQSRTVVFHYKLAGSKNGGRPDGMGANAVPIEEPEARADRLVKKLQGLLREELKEYGGAEGFMRWIRHDEEPVG